MLKKQLAALTAVAGLMVAAAMTASTATADEITPILSESPSYSESPSPTPVEMTQTFIDDPAIGVLTVTGTPCDDFGTELIGGGEYQEDASRYAPIPADVTMPYGAMAFGVCVQTGSTITVTWTTPAPVNAIFKTIDDKWTPFPSTISGNTATWQITDGGYGDMTGEVNGIISDPVAASIVVNMAG